MYPVSDLYKLYLLNPNREFDARVIIDSTEYTGSSIVNFDIDDVMVAGDEFAIGTVIPTKLTLQIKTDDEIPSNAKVTPQIKMKGGLVWNYITMSWQQTDIPWDSQETEIIPQGEFYIDDRKQNNGVWTFTAYDKLMLTEQMFVSALIYPTTMQAVIDEICSQLSIIKDASVVINPAYMIPYKSDEYSIREMLRYIAMANGSSVRMTKDGKLAFVKFNGTPEAITGNDYYKCELTNPVKTISKIIVTTNKEGDTLEAGTGADNQTMCLYNPFMTQAIVNDLQAIMNGFSYQPYKMEWKGFPHIDAGDRLAITLRDGSTITTPIFAHKVTYTGGMKATTSANSVSEQKSEFAYKGTVKKDVEVLNKTAVKQEVPYYGVSFSKAAGITIEKSDGSSMAVFNSDKLAFQVNGVDAIYFDPVAGKYKFNGTIEAADGVFDGTVKAANIDVTEGKISTLQIESLTVGTNVSMGPNVTIAWENVNGAPNVTHIDSTGIYTGSIDAAQITAGVISGDKISGGTITGALYQSKPNGQQHVQIYDDAVRVIDSSNAAVMGFAADLGATNRSSFFMWNNSQTAFGELYLDDTEMCCGSEQKPLNLIGTALNFNGVPVASSATVTAKFS